MLKDLGWLELASRRKDLRLALFYKIVNSLIAVPADEIDLTPTNPRTRELGHRFWYKPILARSSTPFEFSFAPRTVTEWNALAASVVDAPSLECFKQRLSKTARD